MNCKIKYRNNKKTAQTKTIDINKAEKLFDNLGEGISEFTSLKSEVEVNKVWDAFWELKKKITGTDNGYERH